MRRILMVVVLGCGREPDASPDVPVDSISSDAMPDALVRESAPLGMNDVSFLLALPGDPDNMTTFVRMTGFPGGEELVPRQVYEQQIGRPETGEITNPFEQFHAVAMRFDLCDHVVVGPCLAHEDGQLRLTFQPLLPTSPTMAADVALHVAYRIPANDLADVVNELRALARVRQLDTGSALMVNESLVAGPPTEYSMKLSQLVAAYARTDNIVRLTVFNQPANQAPFIWHFSGLEPRAGVLTYIDIPGLNISWQVQEAGPDAPMPSYNVSPVAENPPSVMAGWIRGSSKLLFASADTNQRQQSLAALAATQDPRRTTIKTIHCAACHVSTRLLAARTAEAGVAPEAIPGRFTSIRNVSIEGGNSATDDNSLRAFGWFDQFPEISERVANETATLLDEIDLRFPPAP